MELLDIKWTKDSSLFLDTMHSLSTGGFLNKTRQNMGEKILKNENSSLFVYKHFVESKNECRKPDKNSSLRRLEFVPRNLG
jgi:hypothetical protein